MRAISKPQNCPPFTPVYGLKIQIGWVGEGPEVTEFRPISNPSQFKNYQRCPLFTRVHGLKIQIGRVGEGSQIKQKYDARKSVTSHAVKLEEIIVRNRHPGKNAAHAKT